MRWLVLAAGLLSWTGCGGAGASEDRELLVYIWADYLAEKTIPDFEKEFGCRVTVKNYSSGLELRSQVISAGGSYDVIFPSDDDLPVLLAADALEPLEAGKLPNLGNLEERFGKETRHAVAYMWGTTGIAYNRDKIKGPVDSWAALWNPEYQPMSMLDDARETFAVAFRLDGRSANAGEPEAIERAKKKLIEQKKHLSPYNTAASDALISGQVSICQCYSGDALKAALENPSITYVIPKEGGTLWVDSVAIPRKARNKGLAHQFVNYLLRPDVSATIANERRYANANRAAREKTDPELLKNPIAYPPEEVLRRCERLQDIGKGRRLIEDAWAEVRLK